MSARSERPSSAQSKTAWGNEGSKVNEGFENDEMPSAMESEVYMEGEVHVVGQEPVKKVVKKKKSCCQKFCGGIRSLWGTRLMADMDDQEVKVKTTLRELAVYVLFLLVLCVITLGMASSTQYYYTKVLQDLFLDSQYADTKNTFRGSTTIEDFWRFVEGPLMDGLYWDKWYNQQNVTDDDRMIYYENKLLGVPRLRQLKVHNTSCTVHTDFEKEILQCFAAYAEAVEEKEPFGKLNGTAWEYTPEKDLESGSHWGYITTYGGGGYYQDLAANKSGSVEIIQELKKNLWIDRGTRVVFVDFTVYNANINLFCQVKLLFEMPPTGGVITSWVFRTVKLLRYVSIMDYIVLGCEGLFILFILYYSIEEILEIKMHKKAYFTSLGNIMDILIIFASIVAMIFNVYRYTAVDSMLDKLLQEPYSFPDFEFLAFWQENFNVGVAITLFFAWLKVFKYISFNKTMRQLSTTLRLCGKDVVGFLIMFLIILFAFTQLAYLIFGTQVKDFSSLKDSLFTLLRIILGDFDFHELEAANRVLGPAFFMFYVFFVFFVLLNMFLAIINDTYSEVKSDLVNQKNDFEVGDFFKKQYDKMLEKLNFKRDKIIDIQKALVAADGNSDRKVDFDEWRQELKMRGYGDSEIEAAFAKYDLDGDRVLDEEEQKQMQTDLEGQKDAINAEFADLEEKIKRPKTGRSRSFEDSGDDSDDEDTTARTKSSRLRSGRGRGMNGVSYEEFTVLSRRVDRMEHSIGSIVSKIDAVLVKLEAMEKAKLKRRETMGKILDSITETEGNGEEVKSRDQMEKLVREELERWDSETSIGQASARGVSPTGSTARARSRPTSANHGEPGLERSNSNSSSVV